MFQEIFRQKSRLPVTHPPEFGTEEEVSPRRDAHVVQVRWSVLKKFIVQVSKKKKQHIRPFRKPPIAELSTVRRDPGKVSGEEKIANVRQMKTARNGRSRYPCKGWSIQLVS